MIACDECVVITLAFSDSLDLDASDVLSLQLLLDLLPLCRIGSKSCNLLGVNLVSVNQPFGNLDLQDMIIMSK